jgi:hypothetical protein
VDTVGKAACATIETSVFIKSDDAQIGEYVESSRLMKSRIISAELSKTRDPGSFSNFPKKILATFSVLDSRPR